MDIFLKILASLVRLCRGKKLIMLTYHRVLVELDEMHPGEVDIAKFTWQMDILQRYFNVLSLSDALMHIREGNLPPCSVCLSFDDGYASCYTEALPILKRFGFSACFFVVSGALNQRGLWNDSIIETVRSVPGDVLDLRHLGLDVYSLANRAEVAQKVVQSVKYLPSPERNELCRKIAELSETTMPSLILTTEQLRELHRQGMEVGGHTVSHPILKNLTTSEAEQEISRNKQDLEQIIKAPVRFFAFPNGKLDDDYLPVHVQLAKKCGYEAAFTSDWGSIKSNTDLWQLPRFTPWDNSPLGFMLRMLIGFIK